MTHGAKVEQARAALRAKIKIELECQVPCIEFLAGRRGKNATEKKTIGTNQQHPGFWSGHVGWANLNVSAGPAAHAIEGPCAAHLTHRGGRPWLLRAPASRFSRTPPHTVA